MILLDVIFGIFAFLPQGWLFMAFVILIVCVIMTKILKKNWFDKRIYGIAALTNVISGIVGIVISMILNGGWYLVVWFPRVSSNEINLSNRESLKAHNFLCFSFHFIHNYRIINKLVIPEKKI